MPDDIDVTVRDLFQRLQNGDETALGQLYRDFWGDLRVYCDWMVGGGEGEDIAQEVITKIWYARASIQPDRSLKAWMYTIAHHSCCDELRRRSRRPGQIPPDREFEDLSPESSPNRGPEARHEVQRMLKLLDPEVRATVVLRELVGLSVEEVGTIVGCSPGQVSRRVANAIKFLSCHIRKDKNR